jgi:hypothetical protein
VRFNGVAVLQLLSLIEDTARPANLSVPKESEQAVTWLRSGTGRSARINLGDGSRRRECIGVTGQ